MLAVRAEKVVKEGWRRGGANHDKILSTLDASFHLARAPLLEMGEECVRLTPGLSGGDRTLFHDNSTRHSLIIT